VTLLAAVLGASKMTPLAGKGFNGTNIQEFIVSLGFISVGLTMVFSLVVMIYGLRGQKLIIHNS
jgi:(hydroxyamino)benzene mutase